MDKNSILFWVSILGFFGLTGLDLINAITKVVSDLYLKLGNIIWIIGIGIYWLYSNRK